MKFNFLLFVSLLIYTSCSNTDKTQQSLAAMDPVLQAMDTNALPLLSDPKINAVSIGVYKDGKKYIRHYGELDKGKGNTPTDQTIYEIASVSKTLTGTLVAKAVLEGQLKLEEDIRTYLKEDFPNFEYNGKPIELKHLLTHTSGLPHFLPESINALMTEFNEELPFRMNEIQEQYSRKAFFNDLHKVKLDTFPGSTYSYSNVDTELVAHILENVYRKSFDELLQNYFGSSASMPHTRIKLSKEEKVRLANGYGMTGKQVPHEPVPLYGAGGGIKTTMPDLVNYMEFQLDSTNSVVAESHRTLYSNGNRKVAYYWPVKTNEEYGTFYSHHGGAFGSQNWFFVLPEKDMGVVVITNQSDLETAGKLMEVVKGVIADMP